MKRCVYSLILNFVLLGVMFLIGCRSSLGFSVVIAGV